MCLLLLKERNKYLYHRPHHILLSSRFVKGTELETDIEFTSEQVSVSTLIVTGVSTQDFNLTQTATGELLFTEIVPSVSVTYTEITHSGDTWTEVTHTGDTWTDITP